MKYVMAKAGINIDIFGAHSCRSASTSSMKSVLAIAGINIDVFGAHNCRSALTFSMDTKV
jgi:anthranilate phosphoribosyltransferase